MRQFPLRRHFCRALAAVLAFSAFSPVRAQEPEAESADSVASEHLNPIERIVESSNGNVEILIDSDLMEKVLTPPTAHKKTVATKRQSALRPGINKLAGYRIQVFSDGRNQATLEARAKARGNAITARFPKYRGQIYTFSSAPNWYTRVGNFRTAAEAADALAELRRSFPNFADEMRVVKCQIVVVR